MSVDGNLSVALGIVETNWTCEHSSLASVIATMSNLG